MLIKYILHTMIQILEKYIIGGSQVYDLESLISTNEHISLKITQLQDKISNLDQQIVSQLPNNLNRYDALKQILQTDKNALEKQLHALNIQESQLFVMKQFIQIYLSECENEPRELNKKLKYMKSIIQKAQSCGCNTRQLQIMYSWKQSFAANLEKKLCNLVKRLPNVINIQLSKIQELRDLITPYIGRNFIKNIFGNILKYDVPSFSYILIYPTQILQKPQGLIIKTQTIIFKAQKSLIHFDNLFKTLQILMNVSQRIVTILQQVQDKKISESITQEIQNYKANIKSIVEYILPFLGIEQRKTILQRLDQKTNSQFEVYDVLVKLRIKGQDAESMSQSLNILIEHIKVNKQSLKNVISFLMICEHEGNSLHIAFYICNELINSLEQCIAYHDLTSLLQIRQSLRFKIHHPA